MRKCATALPAWRAFLVVLSLALSCHIPFAAALESDSEAVALLRLTEQQLRPGTSTSAYQVLIVRPEWQRVLRFRSFDDRINDRFRLEVIDPVKIRGTVFLKVGGALSMYLPKLKRTIAISPVMMQDEWMGSDFNNQDLVDAGALIDHYAHRVVARERQGDAEVITIESTARGDSPVVWDRLVQRVRSEGVPVEVEYRDARGTTLRRLSFHDVREMGGRRIPTRWVMEPLDRPGQRTEIVIEEVEFGVPIPASLFEVSTGVKPP